ncbi:6181_t:CDS:2, partial [Acaulospora morrowiae]
MEDTPVNAAHAFANAAEEFEEKELWAKAMEAHFRAAEQFLSAMNYTSDPEAIRTLKLLYANHTRQGKELQR